MTKVYIGNTQTKQKSNAMETKTNRRSLQH